MSEFKGRLIALATKLPYYKKYLGTQTDRDTAATALTDAPGTTSYTDGDVVEVIELTPYELAPGTVDDAVVAAGAVGSISAKLRRLTTDLAALLAKVPAALTGGGGVKAGLVDAIPAGDNNIGNVDIVTLPVLPAGTNNIGDVDVLTLPSLPAGSNAIGSVDIDSLPALAAGSNMIGKVVNISTGASTIATSQVPTSTSSALLIAERLTRRRLVLQNLDGTNDVYIGPSGVDETTGLLLVHGTEKEFFTTAVFHVKASAGTPKIAILEEYDDEEEIGG